MSELDIINKIWCLKSIMMTYAQAHNLLKKAAKLN